MNMFIRSKSDSMNAMKKWIFSYLTITDEPPISISFTIFFKMGSSPQKEDSLNLSCCELAEFTGSCSMSHIFVSDYNIGNKLAHTSIQMNAYETLIIIVEIICVSFRNHLPALEYLLAFQLSLGLVGSS